MAHNGPGKLRYFQCCRIEKLPFTFFLFLGSEKKFKIIVNIYYKLLRVS